MASITKSIVWFDEIGKDDIGLVGGKGANLGELTAAGIPVPPGFVVTADTYMTFIKDSRLERVLEELLTDLDVSDGNELNRVSQIIKRSIREREMPPHIADEIREAYEELGGGPVAVRSSATAEDLPEASFAGQQSTYLNVVGAENVAQAVQACWASLFEARAIFYRQEAGYDHMKVALAVPVQKMVQSERSGVLFTVEPVSSDRTKMVIEAVLGLGEAIVSGETTPDLYVLDKQTLEIIERNIARQERMLVKDPEVDGSAERANIWMRVPEAKREAPKLTDPEIVALAEIGKRVERHYGYPQDIEWAEEGGQFYLVQTRPVTTIRESDEAAAVAEEETQPIILKGSAASPGVATGVVKIVRDPSEMHIVQPGDVLVAEMTTPDYVPAMKKAVAIVTDNGGRTCHAAIVSRELGIPCVVGTGSGTGTLREGQQVTVDGSTGAIYEGVAEARLAWAEREKNRYASAANLKTKTRLYVNLAEPELADVVAKRNVDGVGLLRAEFICTQIGEHPRHFIDTGRGHEWTAKLAEGLEKFAAAFSPRPVVYRMTDFKTNEYRNLLGGDKYEKVEENPMIGYRGASRYVREEDLTKLEVAAIKQVRAKYKNLYVMIPFVRTPAQLRGVKQLLEREGLVQSADFKLWMMVEVPSNVLILDKFIDEGIDGISIGSNDLTQLVLGIDRDSGELAEDFDERDEAVMWAIERAVTTARRRGITASICGQAPSVYPEVTKKLVEWGITSVSVSPDMIDQTRQIIADLEAAMEPKAPV